MSEDRSRHFFGLRQCSEWPVWRPATAKSGLTAKVSFGPTWQSALRLRFRRPLKYPTHLQAHHRDIEQCYPFSYDPGEAEPLADCLSSCKFVQLWCGASNECHRRSVQDQSNSPIPGPAWHIGWSKREVGHENGWVSIVRFFGTNGCLN